MKFPLKLKIVDLKTGEESDGLAVLKPSIWKTGDDIVVLSNSVKLRGTSFPGEKGFKYAYDFFNIQEKKKPIEEIMRDISFYASSRFQTMIIIEVSDFKEISL